MADITGAGACGVHRVANDIAGYVAYVGVDALPDFTATPQYSATLPFTVATVPPVSGTKTYNVCVRSRNQYGLESQNQYCTPFTIDSAGLPVLKALPTPQSLAAWAGPGGTVYVQAAYPGMSAEANPADEWRLWVNSGTVDPDVDMPTLTANVRGGTITMQAGPFAAGTYNVVIALFRNADVSRSAVASTTVTVTAAPTVVDALPNGSET